jgi:hypothetical protein
MWRVETSKITLSFILAGFNRCQRLQQRYSHSHTTSYHATSHILHDVVATILTAMSKNHLIEGRQRPTVIGYDTTTVSSRASSSS